MLYLQHVCAKVMVRSRVLGLWSTEETMQICIRVVYCYMLLSSFSASHTERSYTTTGQMITGVARTQPKPGHTMGTLHFQELMCNVQKQLGGSGGMFPQTLMSLPGDCEAILGHNVSLNQERFGHAFSINLCTV